MNNAVRHKGMVAGVLCLTLLLCQVARAADAPDVRRIHSGEELAKFISTMIANETADGLLAGLDRTGSIRIASYTNAFPIREIYGTIVEERYGDALRERLYEHGKEYGVREICSFRDGRGQIQRFHIGMYEARQYRLMEDFLKREIVKKHKAQQPNKPTTVHPLDGKSVVLEGRWNGLAKEQGQIICSTEPKTINVIDIGQLPTPKHQQMVRVTAPLHWHGMDPNERRLAQRQQVPVQLFPDGYIIRWSEARWEVIPGNL